MENLGRYQIQKELGRGAMGTVYRAYDPKIDRVVALKTISIAAGITPEEEDDFRKRFMREAQAAGKLSHPGIVAVHDVAEDEATRTPFIVMEYVEGQTLEVLGRTEKLPVDKTLELAAQLAEALDYAHERGIVHRDIKPANILVTPDGRAKITDFGIAKLQQAQLTQPGQILGTPAFMSPEQLTGGTVDGRSDLFSLGAVLYWLLTGEKPFSGESMTSVSFKVAYQEPISASQLNPAISPEIACIVHRALAKDPAQRYPRACEFAEDLESLLQGRRPKSLGDASVKMGAIERTVVVESPLRPTAPGPRTAVASSRSVFERLGRLPQIALAAVVAVIVLVAVLAFWRGGPAETSTLVVKCSHSFRAADFTVWVGGDEVYAGTLSGVVTKEWGVFETVRGSFSETLRVPAGTHVVRVRVSAPAEGYEQTREIQGELAKDSEKTLVISFGRKGRDLFLSLQ